MSPLTNSRNLFESPAVKYELPAATLTYFPAILSPDQSARLMQALTSELGWQQPELRMGARRIPIPRLQCWMGDPEARYGYSGLQLEPQAWHPLVLEIRGLIQMVTAETFNSVLINQYRDGRDSVSWHRDNEPELGPNPIIASLSLGAERLFELRHRTRKDLPMQRLLLADGSLLLMDHRTQNHWVHQLPKTRSDTGPRLNLTFRRILASGIA